MKFNLCSKFMIVLFASILLQGQAHGKPFESLKTDETGQASGEENHESNQAMENETSSVRGKREVAYNLMDFCQTARYHPSSSSNSCVKGRYYCHGYADVVCNAASFQCLSNVRQCGGPKCTPVYDSVTIDLGSQGKLKVRRSKTCQCAKCPPKKSD